MMAEASSKGTTLQPLAFERHGAYYWQRACDYRHAADRTLVPVTARELPRAVGAFPLLLTGAAERPVLTAILGAQPGRSAFVDGRGRWRGAYVPAYLRGHPFYLAEVGPQRYAVAVDEQAEALQADRYTGEALFTDAGEPSAALEPVLEFLEQLARSRVATDRACQALAEHGLLTDWEPQVRTADGQYRRLAGLRRVDEARLNALDGEALRAVRDAGALPVAYGQLLSQGQLRRLEAQAVAREREAQASVPDAEAIFGEPPLEARIDWDALDFGDEPPEQG